MHSAETPTVTRLGAEEARRTFPPRRRLDKEQEREVTRLYAETSMPVPQISKQFAIGESSVYRIAARNGAGLRGRVQAAAPAEPETLAASPAPAIPRRARRTAATASTAPTPTATRARRRRTPAAVTSGAAPRATPAATPTRTRRPRTTVAGGALQRFQVRFRAEAILQAADIQAALRQLESLGATDVLAIVRQDR